MTPLQLLLWRGLAPALAVVLSACAGKAPVPDWQMNAHGAAERATEVCLDAIQLMGGMGYVNETGVGRLLRDAKLYEIGGGTTEVRKIVIARSFSQDYI